MNCGHRDLGDSYHGGRPFQCICQFIESKRCPRCGCLQIAEGFPMHKQRDGTRRRSPWCIECWHDHSARRSDVPGGRRDD